MRNRVLIIYGHPLSDSFNSALGKAYAEGARASGAQVHELFLEQLEYDSMLHAAYKQKQELEVDLLKLQEEISWAEHVVVVFPIWWGGMPIKLKGAFDRIFHPGWAFKYHAGAKFPEQLLKGRSGRIIMTMDNCPILYRWLYKKPVVHQLRDMTLKFCGISPVKVSMYGSVRFSSVEKRISWLEKVKELGGRDLG